MYDYLDLRQTERLKELVPYKALAPDADEIIKELDRLNNIIKDLIKDIEIIVECEDINIIKMQLRTCLYNKLKELKENNK